jgi:hypothetical protein
LVFLQGQDDMANEVPHVELPQPENDLTETALFKELRAIQTYRDPLDDKVAAQAVFDDVLSQLGERAVAPERGETNAHYLAVLGTQAAQYGPDERKRIDRCSLPPAALAEVAREDLAIAKAEIERPHHSLRPGEVREVTKVDRSGRPAIEFYSLDGPSFWMKEFMDPVVRLVSGGSRGIATTDRSGYYSFNKLQTNPELQAMVKHAEYMDSAEYKIAKAYTDAGLEAPDVAALLNNRR